MASSSSLSYSAMQPSHDESKDEDGTHFFSRQVSALPKSSIIKTFRSFCETSEFQDLVARWGFSGVSFDFNPNAGGFNPNEGHNKLHDQFLKACRSLPNNARLAVVFHGTHEDNIPAILKNGLDPKKRKMQAYGPGEYFSKDPGLSVGYCKKKENDDGRGPIKILIFVVAVPSIAMQRDNCPSNIVVVPTSEHQLPLGVLSSKSVDRSTLLRSVNMKSRLQQLSQQVNQKMQQAEVALIKAKIIQLLIQDSLDIAGEKYSRNIEILDMTSKREISMYAHQRFDSDFVVFYFPDLPEPMSADERDVSAMKSVEAMEQEVLEAKKVLAMERLKSST